MHPPENNSTLKGVASFGVITNTAKDNINLHGRYCTNPFNQFEVTENGRVWLCCPNQLPHPIGNVLHTPDFDDIWNGEKALLVRRSILNGKFNYCHHFWCPEIQTGTLPIKKDLFGNNQFTRTNIPNAYGPKQEAEWEMLSKDVFKGQREWTDEELKMPPPTMIAFSNDRSCNLHCPSCRPNKIMHSSGRALKTAQLITDKLVSAFLTEPTDRYFKIHLLGSGDIFSSKPIREMLYNIDGAVFPNLEIDLITNGILLTEKMWKRLHKIHKNLTMINISVDAGTKETYEQKTRLGGNWDVLLKNIDYLYVRKWNHDSLENHGFNFVLLYVVQANNYKEMVTFANLINKYDKINIYFSLVDDWGQVTFNQDAVWQTTHPDHNEFLEVLQHPIFDHPNIQIGNLTKFRNT